MFLAGLSRVASRQRKQDFLDTMVPDSAYVVVDWPTDQFCAWCPSLPPQLVELLDLLSSELILRLYHHVRPSFGFGVRKLDHGLYHWSTNACECHKSATIDRRQSEFRFAPVGAHT